MTLRKHDDGKWYGTVDVLLTRIVDGETEQIVGSRAPFGGIYVRNFGTKRNVEEWDEYWIGHGFEVVEPSILQRARDISRGGA